MWSTHILDSARAKKKQEREQLRVRLLDAAMQALDKLSLLLQFDQAYVFGSVARPQGFDELSDLDIAFVGLRDEDYFTAAAFLSREVGIDEVDVVQLEGHRLASTIVKEGIPWKKKG
jgi:predicted nucleotidyltransferase